MRIANLFNDRDILTKAQKCAEEILKDDKNLEKSEYFGIKEKITELTNKASAMN